MRRNVLLDGPVLQIEHEGPPLTVPLVEERRPPARNRTLRWELLAVFAISLLLSIALFHKVWSWPFSTLIGGAGDSDEYTWFLAWVPFAIRHGLDPLVSNYVNYPGGVNLMWNTSVLLPSFLMTPVTAIFGATFSYNALVTLAPVLNATFGYVAFRRWTGRLPALCGALVFGFSPYIVSQSVGHLAQTLLVSAPLMLIVLDRLVVVQSKKPWVDGLLLGLLAWAQLLTGEEVLAMEAATGAIAIAGAVRDRPPGRKVPFRLRAPGWPNGCRRVRSAVGPVPCGPVLRSVQGARRPPAQRVRERPIELFCPDPYHPVRPGGGAAGQLPFHGERLRAGCLHRYPPCGRSSS